MIPQFKYFCGYDCSEVETAFNDWIYSQKKMFLQVNVISHDVTCNHDVMAQRFVLSIVYTTDHYDFNKELGYDDDDEY